MIEDNLWIVGYGHHIKAFVFEGFCYAFSDDTGLVCYKEHCMIGAFGGYCFPRNKLVIAGDHALVFVHKGGGKSVHQSIFIVGYGIFKVSGPVCYGIGSDKPGGTL